MAIYIMDGRTFLKTYIHKEDPNKVLSTQFVMVTSMLRKGGRYEEQVINADPILYPPSMMVIDYEDYKNPDYKTRYFEYLRERAMPFLATIIKYSMDSDENVVFLCSLREWDYRYLQMMRKFVLEEFKYHIYDYKKVQNEKEHIVEDDEAYTLHICDKVLKKAKKDKIKIQKRSDKGREEYVGDLSKEELIQKLKKRNLYIKGMSKSEMVDTLLTFL